MESVSPPPKLERLMSLDAYRGFAMFLKAAENSRSSAMGLPGLLQ